MHLNTKAGDRCTSRPCHLACCMMRLRGQLSEDALSQQESCLEAAGKDAAMRGEHRLHGMALSMLIAWEWGDREGLTGGDRSWCRDWNGSWDRCWDGCRLWDGTRDEGSFLDRGWHGNGCCGGCRGSSCHSLRRGAGSWGRLGGRLLGGLGRAGCWNGAQVSSGSTCGRQG